MLVFLLEKEGMFTAGSAEAMCLESLIYFWFWSFHMVCQQKESKANQEAQRAHSC